MVSKSKHPKHAKSPSSGRRSPERKRTILWLLIIVLVLGTGAWWLIQRASVSSNRLIVEQAREVLVTSPDLAEQMLALLENKADGEIFDLLAEAQVRQGKLSLAEETVRQWTLVTPSDGDAWTKLATIQQMQNRIVDSQETLRLALLSAASPSQRDSLRLRLIEYSLLADDHTEAKRLRDQLETAEAQQAFEQSLSFAQLLRLNGSLAEAYRATQQYLARNKKTESEIIAARMLSGIIQLDQQNFHEAAEDLAAVVAASPKNKEAHYKLAMALRSLNRQAEAAEHLKISSELTTEVEREASTHPPAIP